MEPNQFFELYRSEFLPAYSDLVSFLVKKPKQVLTEIENTFSHISQHFNPSLDATTREENLTKAYDHIVRATIDCYKLLWVKMKEELDAIYFDDKKRVFALNMKEDEFVRKYQEFRNKAKDARNFEINNIGSKPIEAIQRYKETIAIGYKLLESVDVDKLRKLSFFKTIITTKECIITIILGIMSGFILGILI